MRLRRITIVVAMAVVAGMLAIAPSAAAATRVEAGQSIQDAVDHASPGDTIVVGPGTFRENVVIQKNGITLRGVDAVLEPPATPGGLCTQPGSKGPGICVAGDVDFDTGEVHQRIHDVTVSGFRIGDFENGVFIGGGGGTKVAGNVLVGNEEYGVFALFSTGTKIVGNKASGAGEAGFYVGGSPDADAKVVANEAFDNGFGIFIRDARGVKVTANNSHDNCVGMVVLADSPGPAGDVKARGNLFRHNDKFCPPGDEGGPPVSGVGVLLGGADNVDLRGNLITGNEPSQPVPFSGGILSVAVGPTQPFANSARGNIVTGNSIDINVINEGPDNSFTGNVCRTSNPASLCAAGGGR